MARRGDGIRELAAIVAQTRARRAPLDPWKELSRLTDEDLGGVPGRRDTLLGFAVPILKEAGLRRPVVRDLLEIGEEHVKAKRRQPLRRLIVSVLVRAGIEPEFGAPPATVPGRGRVARPAAPGPFPERNRILYALDRDSDVIGRYGTALSREARRAIRARLLRFEGYPDPEVRAEVREVRRELRLARRSRDQAACADPATRDPAEVVNKLEELGELEAG